jgi:type VI secretion system protein ImpL
VLNSFIAKFAALTRLPPTAARWMVIATLAILAAAVVVPLVWFLGPRVPTLVWAVIGAVLLGLLLVWLVFRGIPRYMEHRFVARHSGDLSPGNASDEQAPRERMLARLEEAKTVWEGSPQFSSVRQPLYWIPFYLVLGDRDADTAELLRSAAPYSPFPAPARAGKGEREWLVWWFHKDAVAIESAPDFVCDTADRVTRGIWYQALQLLRSARTKQPLNGFVVVVSAAQLTGTPDALREYGLRIRRLLDEAMAQLQMSGPVYIVVNHIDRLGGGKAFLESLPKEAFAQAFGHVFPAPQAGEEAWQQAKAVFAEIEGRIQAIRFGALMRDTDALVKAQCFRFVAEFGALQTGLELFTRTLFEENVLQRRIPWRGLFFVSTIPGRHFLTDLFVKFLPADQPLAQRSRQKKLFGLASLGVTLGLAALLATFTIYRLGDAHREDRAVVAQAEGACARLSAEPPVAERFAACHDEIVKLDIADARRGFTFGLDSASEARSSAQHAFSDAYRKHVLAVVDKTIESDLAQKKTELRGYIALAQRLTLIGRCREGGKGCPVDDNGYFHALASPLDFPELAWLPATAAGDRLAARLALAFARWSDAKALDETLSSTHVLLGKLAGSALPEVRHLIDWGNRRSTALTSAEVWRPGHGSEPTTAPPKSAVPVIPGLDLPAPGSSEVATASVSSDPEVVPGAFRRRVSEWIEGPMVAALEALGGGAAVAARTLDERYRQAYFGAWGTFLSRFAVGVDVWTGDHQSLAQQMLGADTPHARLMRVFREEVRDLPGAAGAHPAWVTSLEGTVNREDGKIRAAVREVVQVVVRDVDGRASYDLARQVFSSAPKADTPALQALLAAIPAVEKPSPEDQKTLGAGDYGPWSAAQGPARLALQLLAYRATEFLDAMWRKEVAAGMEGKSPREQVDYLLGGAGRLRWFHDTWMTPFSSGADGLPVARLGVSLPINTDFLAYVRQAERDRSKAGGAPVNAGVVQVFASSLGGAPEGPGGTVFELNCQGQKFTASSKGVSLADTRVNVFWSPTTCLDVTIRISLAPAEVAPAIVQVPALQLVKTYAGAEAFLKVVREFKTGSKVFRLQDFADSYTPGQWKSVASELARLGVTGARVNLRIEPTPDLEMFLSGPRKPPTTLLPARFG